MTSTPVVETPLPISSLAIQRRVILKQGKDDIAFSFAMDLTAPPADFYQAMDLISSVSDRENLKAQLVEKREALIIAKAQPGDIERDIERTRVEKMAYTAARESRHDRTRQGTLGRAWKPTEKELQELDQFEQKIASGEVALKNFKRDVPIVEWEIACLEARIAGQELPPKPKELEDAIDAMKFAA